jgi:ABC-type oligopeptide transport system substrate-binding subunit
MRWLAVCALVLVGCHADQRYFGNVTPPSRQRLVYVNTDEPSSLDPDINILNSEANLSNAIFEGLTVTNPFTMEPMAGMATHYEIGADGKDLTFYLRGHRNPKGTRLPGVESLPAEFSHGERDPPDSVPALWSDGTMVTAGDYVYALRRRFTPGLASLQSLEPVILNSADIKAGKRRPQELGVEAPDDFTLHLRLTVPASYYLVTQAWYTDPHPRRAMEKAKAEGRPDAWARPPNAIGNGPFVLAEWRPYDYIRVTKSRTYYARNLVRLEEIKFLPLKAGPAVVNLYRTGMVQSLYPDSMTIPLVPALETKPDLRRDSQYSVVGLYCNMREPPFDNQMVRWALNMAIDKGAVAKYWRAEVLRHVAPAMPGYTPPESTHIAVHGMKYDVMAYNPAGARELLAEAGYSGGGKRLAFTINTTNEETSLENAEIVRQLLEKELGAQIRVNTMESNVLLEGIRNRTLRGVHLAGWGGDGADPYSFLRPEVVERYGGWRDPQYLSALEAANSTPDTASRLRKLAACERRLMESMPMIPICLFPAVYLQKPYVHGLISDKLGVVWFRYAWIDTRWKP